MFLLFLTIVFCGLTLSGPPLMLRSAFVTLRNLNLISRHLDLISCGS
jgi:hypothetical protein